jgi:hypothetical protein
MVTLSQIKNDIIYLKKRSVCSFGKTINTGKNYIICGIPVEVYYYTDKNKKTYTPYKENEFVLSNYEGKHHPVCKINFPILKDYTFTENGIKYKGKEFFSTETWENNKDYNDELLMGVIIACCYSLSERLKYYKQRLENAQPNDRGHMGAPYRTYKTLNKVVNLVSNKNCVYNFLEKYNVKGIMKSFDELSSSGVSPLKPRNLFLR